MARTNRAGIQAHESPYSSAYAQNRASRLRPDHRREGRGELAHAAGTGPTVGACEPGIPGRIVRPDARRREGKRRAETNDTA